MAFRYPHLKEKGLYELTNPLNTRPYTQLSGQDLQGVVAFIACGHVITTTLDMIKAYLITIDGTVSLVRNITPQSVKKTYAMRIDTHRMEPMVTVYQE